MANILTKTAGNITQSVASALIVFLITTYILVDLGKKEKSNEAKPDSVAQPIDVPQVKPAAPKEQTPLGPTVAVPQSRTEQRLTAAPQQKETGNRPAAEGGEAAKPTDEEVGGTIPPKPVEPKQDPTAQAARAKGDSLTKDKRLKQEIKKVQKRADEVFDELEEETEKKPPPDADKE